MSLDDALRAIVRDEVRAALADLLPAAQDPPAALTLAEAAERTRLSERTLRRAIDGGRLHALRAGRAVRIPVEALEDFMRGAA